MTILLAGLVQGQAAAPPPCDPRTPVLAGVTPVCTTMVPTAPARGAAPQDPLTTVGRLPSARLGLYYNQLVIKEGTPPYTVTAKSVLPAGLDVDPKNGRLTGYPKRIGSHLVRIAARDSSTPARLAEGQWRLTVLPKDRPRTPDGPTKDSTTKVDDNRTTNADTSADTRPVTPFALRTARTWHVTNANAGQSDIGATAADAAAAGNDTSRPATPDAAGAGVRTDAATGGRAVNAASARPAGTAGPAPSPRRDTGAAGIGAAPGTTAAAMPGAAGTGSTLSVTINVQLPTMVVGTAAAPVVITVPASTATTPVVPGPEGAGAKPAAVPPFGTTPQRPARAAGGDARASATNGGAAAPKQQAASANAPPLQSTPAAAQVQDIGFPLPLLVEKDRQIQSAILPMQAFPSAATALAARRYSRGTAADQPGSVVSRTRALASRAGWTVIGDCRCRLQARPRKPEVYGFLFDWSGPGPIDASRYDRLGIGIIGIEEDGAAKSAIDTWTELPRLAADLQAHGTAVDLVIHAASPNVASPDVAKQQKPTATIDTAQIDAILTRVDKALVLPSEPRLVSKWLLLPAWRPPVFAFDGVTLVVTPPDSGVDDPGFMAYFETLRQRLVDHMDRQHRPLQLNIVIPDDPFCLAGPATPPNCKAGAFALDRLLKDTRASADSPATPGCEPVAGNVRICLLVMLKQYTGTSKKLLRVNIDRLDDDGTNNRFVGDGRTQLLKAIRPLLVMPVKDGKVPAGGTKQLQRDLGYFMQNFGGVAYWPAPAKATPYGDEVARLTDKALGNDAAAGVAWLPDWVRATGWKNTEDFCSPLLRMTWQLLVLATLIGWLAVLLWWGSWRNRSILQWATIGCGVIAVVVGGFLLTFDPTLGTLKDSNWLLLAVVPLLAGGVIYFTKHRAIPVP
jgi:hypothetical protein